MKNKYERTIYERLEELTNILKGEDIFNNRGMSNEVNFNIFDYDPEDEYIVRDYIESDMLQKQKTKIQVFNIYDMIIEILEDKGFIEKSFEYEKTKGTKKLNDLISKTIGIGSNKNLLINKIKERIKPNHIIFIIGTAQAFNTIRGSQLLTALEIVVSNNPLIMFYPGKYNGLSFDLFNILENDNYYRAFQIVSRK